MYISHFLLFFPHNTYNFSQSFRVHRLFTSRDVKLISDFCHLFNRSAFRNKSGTRTDPHIIGTQNLSYNKGIAALNVYCTIPVKILVDVVSPTYEVHGSIQQSFCAKISPDHYIATAAPLKKTSLYRFLTGALCKLTLSCEEKKLVVTTNYNSSKRYLAFYKIQSFSPVVFVN